MLNRVTLVGRLGRDPELKQTANGLSYANVSLATSKKVKGEEKTTWHNLVAFNKTAEILAEYGKKGRLVLVEGELEVDQYEKDGVKRTSTKVVVGLFRNLEWAGGNADDQSVKTSTTASEFEDIHF